MTRTKIFFATTTFLLLTTSLVAQEQTSEQTEKSVPPTPTTTIIYNANDVENNILEMVSIKDYEEGIIPERVTQLLKESLLEKTVLAEKIC